MTALKALAREKGYFNVSPWEQALRCVELAGRSSARFRPLDNGRRGGGRWRACALLALSRTAFLGHDLAHNIGGHATTRNRRFMLGLVALFQGFGSTWWVEKHELHHAFPTRAGSTTTAFLRRSTAT